jgi:hypothetical protein
MKTTPSPRARAPDGHLGRDVTEVIDASYVSAA